MIHDSNEGIYGSFARVYDIFMDNVPYEEWGDYICSLLEEYGIGEGIVVELGCGTGSMTEILAGYGYDMIGVDSSADMLEIASEKKARSGHDILYLQQDMREFELFGTVKAAISVCDSVNYITDPDDLAQVFRLVNNYLDPGGIFIFDFNTVHKYRDVIGDSTIAEDRGVCSFIWDNCYYEDERINEYDLTLFIQEGALEEQGPEVPAGLTGYQNEEDDRGMDGELYGNGKLYRKYIETHFQRGYTAAEMRGLLDRAGLEFVAEYDAFTRSAPTEESERIYMVAREHGKSRR